MLAFTCEYKYFKRHNWQNITRYIRWPIFLSRNPFTSSFCWVFSNSLAARLKKWLDSELVCIYNSFWLVNVFKLSLLIQVQIFPNLSDWFNPNCFTYDCFAIQMSLKTFPSPFDTHWHLCVNFTLYKTKKYHSQNPGLIHSSLNLYIQS